MKQALCFQKKMSGFCTKYILLIILLTTGVSLDIVIGQHAYPPPVSMVLNESNLPVLIIDTYGIALKNKDMDERIAASLKIIDHGEGKKNNPSDTIFAFQGYAGIKYRGNSSFSSSPKKPYAIEVWDMPYAADSVAKDISVPLLGMPAASDWILLAPYADKTLFRDPLMSFLFQQTIRFVPQTRFCELIFNGKYYGLYILMEKTERHKNRINIQSSKNTTGNPGESGYHLEIDRDDEPGFRSGKDIRNLYGNKESWRVKPWYQFEYPKAENLTEEQKNFIMSKIDSMETLMESPDFNKETGGYKDFFDTESMAVYIIAQEFSRNIDGYRLSTPIYKYAESVDKRFFFTIRDFNISLGGSDYGWGWSAEGWSYNQTAFASPFWFKKVMQDDSFHNQLKNKWTELRKSKLSDNTILHTVDSLYSLISDAAGRNNLIWEMSGKKIWPAFFITQEYESEIAWLKDWILKRTAWLDNQWLYENKNLVANGSFDCDGNYGLREKSLFTASQWPHAEGRMSTDEHAYDGNYAYKFSKRTSSTQIITELQPGNYTFSARVKTSGKPDAYMYVKNHGQAEKKINIPNEDGEFRFFEIRDIPVSNRQCEVAIASWFSSGSTTSFAWFDQVSFYKQEKLNTGLKDSDLKNLIIFGPGNESFSMPEMTEPVKFGIFNTSGMLVQSGNIQPGEYININLKLKGIYILSIQTKTGNKNIKFVI